MVLKPSHRMSEMTTKHTPVPTTPSARMLPRWLKNSCARAVWGGEAGALRAQLPTAAAARRDALFADSDHVTCDHSETHAMDAAGRRRAWRCSLLWPHLALHR